MQTLNKIASALNGAVNSQPKNRQTKKLFGKIFFCVIITNNKVKLICELMAQKPGLKKSAVRGAGSQT